MQNEMLQAYAHACSFHSSAQTAPAYPHLVREGAGRLPYLLSFFPSVRMHACFSSLPNLSISVRQTCRAAAFIYHLLIDLFIDSFIVDKLMHPSIDKSAHSPRLCLCLCLCMGIEPPCSLLIHSIHLRIGSLHQSINHSIMKYKTENWCAKQTESQKM
mmetsp:Transcript_31619/g.62550  ORF Transcript_31619/g.62550 Transcript_31619/m.62550 type:complete len:158 (-) Transcript_31619:9-482(-)